MKLIFSQSKFLHLLIVLSGCRINIENPDTVITESADSSSVKECTQMMDGVCVSNGELRVFLSSNQSQPNAGTEGADKVCEGDALSNGLDGRYQALISTSKESAGSRIGEASGGYWLGTSPEVLELVSFNLLNASVKNLERPINVMANYKVVSGKELVITGTRGDGTHGHSCNNFRDNRRTSWVTIGLSAAVDSTFLDADFNQPGGVRPWTCDRAKKLRYYCVMVPQDNAGLSRR